MTVHTRNQLLNNRSKPMRVSREDVANMNPLLLFDCIIDEVGLEESIQIFHRYHQIKAWISDNDYGSVSEGDEDDEYPSDEEIESAVSESLEKLFSLTKRLGK